MIVLIASIVEKSFLNPIWIFIEGSNLYLDLHQGFFKANFEKWVQLPCSFVNITKAAVDVQYLFKLLNFVICRLHSIAWDHQSITSRLTPTGTF
jgi:hypothetical protein